MTDSPSGRNGPSTEGGANSGENDSLADYSLDVRELTALVSDHAVALLDADGTVATWNDGAKAVLGYGADAIVGSHYRAFFPADARDDGRPERLLERARTEGRAETEGWRVRGDDDRCWVREVIAPIRNGDGPVGDADATSDGDLRGYCWFVHDRTAEREREQELREEKAFTESVFEAQPDLLYAYDLEHGLIQWNDQFQRVTGYEPDELAGEEPLAFIAPDDRDRLADAIDRILEAGERVTAEGDILTKDGERIPYEFNSARITDDDGTVLGFAGVGRDISDRKARERELERLERLNAVVRTVDELLVTAETREEIERAIVEEFAAADPYRFAVIGRLDPAGASDRRSWEPQAWAGIDPTEETDVLASFVDPPPGAPGRSPLETGEVQRYRNLPERAVDAWRRDARERGYGSIAVVPITAGERSFGVLLIAAVEPEAFADREREVLQEFGGTIGHAINAMTVRRLLYRNEVVELELESTDRGEACIDLSARADCRLTLDHVLPLSGDLVGYYVTITGADPDRVRDAAAAQPAIREIRCIDVRADSEESTWEFTIRGSTVGELLAGYGARLRSKTVESGHATMVIEASPDAAVRELIGALQSAYPETTLVSKRSVEQPVETSGDFRTRVESALTDKQRTALEAAYYSGYFEWPTRNSDAGDIADQLGIARQTFHQHLRVAQEKLLTAYFERDA